MELGLVDSMGSLWTAGRAIHKEMKLSSEFALKFIEKKKKMGLFEFVNSIEESVNHLNFNSLIKSSEQPRLMFK